MPPAKETKAHMLIAAHVRQRNSIGGSQTQVGSPSREFKMKRFADVQGRISTNIPRKQSKTPAQADPVETLAAYGLEPSQPEPTPAQPGEEQKQE